MDFHQYKSELLARIKTEIAASDYGAISVYQRESADRMLYAALKELEGERLIEILPQRTSTDFDIRATGQMWRNISKSSSPPPAPPPRTKGIW